MFKVIIDLAEDEDLMVTSFVFGTYEMATAFIQVAMSHQEENYSYTIKEVENNG